MRYKLSGIIDRCQSKLLPKMSILRLPANLLTLEHVGVGLEASTVDGADVPLIGGDVFAKVGESPGAVPAEVAFENEYDVGVDFK